MPEDQKEDVQEVVQPEAGKAAENTQTPEQEVPQEERPNSQEHNWKEVREIMQQQRDEITQLKEQINTSKEKVSPPQDPLEGLQDDDVLTVADTKKIVAQYARKVSEEVLKENQKKYEYENVPNQYSDFHDVIKLGDEYLKENPTAKDAIMASPNPRLAAYHMIKSSSLYQRHLAKSNNAEKVEKVINNSNKPGSSQSVGTTSPLSDIGKYEKMTPKRAAEIRRQAEEYASKR